MKKIFAVFLGLGLVAAAFAGLALAVVLGVLTASVNLVGSAMANRFAVTKVGMSKDTVAEIIDPTLGTVHTVRAGTAGVFYARILHRYIQAGLEIGKIAGSVPFRTGNLLGN